MESERCCEFSKLRDGHRTDAQKEAKSPTVGNGIRASSFEILTANMAQLLTVGNLTNSWNFIFGDSNWKFCKVGYPIDVDISDVGFALFLFLSDFFFFLNLLDIQEQCLRKLGKIRSELKLLYGIYY